MYPLESLRIFVFRAVKYINYFNFAGGFNCEVHVTQFTPLITSSPVLSVQLSGTKYIHIM